MADLEDTILKQNIPGKWSTFDANSIGHREDNNNNEDEDECINREANNRVSPENEEESLMNLARNLAYSDVPEPIRQSIIAQRLRNPSTGVKGVLADYKTDQAFAHAQKQAEIEYREAVLHRIANGTTIYSTHSNHTKHPIPIELHDDDDDDDDDDDFLQQFRMKRIQEMKSSSSLPIYSSVLEITSQAQFLSEVERADHRSKVIVHLYDPSITSCVKVNKFFENISIKYSFVKFLRMHSNISGILIDRIAFPMITIYSGGETIKVLAGIEQDLGERFTEEDIEWLLECSDAFNNNL